MAGLVELARWWRGRQRQDPGLAARLLPPDVQAAKPRTQLLHVARSREGRQFLQGRVRALQGEARGGAETAAAIGSMLHLLGELAEAEAHLQRAVDRDGRFRCQLERVRRERAAQLQLRLAAQDRTLKRGVWETIDRVDAASLSKDDFLRRYARPGVPVIIQGLVGPDMFAKGAWTRDRLRGELGAKSFVPRRRVPRSGDWASLEDAPAVSIASFLDSMGAAGDAEAAPADTYLFDWNLPDNAPALCEELSIPVYFADDFLQQLPEGAVGVPGAPKAQSMHHNYPPPRAHPRGLLAPR